MTVTMQPPEWSDREVEGTTLEEVARYIQSLPEAGDTQWHATYQVTQWGDGNTIVTADVDVRITVVMPHWAGVTSRPQAEQDVWKTFCEALKAHEQGHIDLARDYLMHADTLLEGQDESTAKQQWEDNLKALQQLSDQYDASNDHGCNAGTTITLPEDSSGDESESQESF